MLGIYHQQDRLPRESKLVFFSEVADDFANLPCALKCRLRAVCMAPNGPTATDDIWRSAGIIHRKLETVQRCACARLMSLIVYSYRHRGILGIRLPNYGAGMETPGSGAYAARVITGSASSCPLSTYLNETWRCTW